VESAAPGRGSAAPGREPTGATFADAAAEYLRYAEQDRGCKPLTIRGYRNTIEIHLLPAFGDMPVEKYLHYAPRSEDAQLVALAFSSTSGEPVASELSGAD
jgi:hypothetical protein